MDFAKMEGSCRCGRIRLEVSAPPLVTNACHCSGCQKMTASAFSLTVSVPAQGFRVAQGEPVRGGDQEGSEHMHCPFCKSWLFTRMAGMTEFVNVRSTMLDDPQWSVPFVETWTSEKLSWVETPAVHSFPRIPELSEWPRLIEDFQKRRAEAAPG